MRCLCKSFLASSVLTVSLTVITFFVISAETDWLRSFANLTSLLVKIPTSLSSNPSTTGMPLILYFSINLKASPRVWSGFIVTGLTTIPASNFLTFLTSDAWSFIVKFLCRTPMPPNWAIVIANLCSVTVSIAAESKGIFNFISFVIKVLTSASAGPNLLCAGCNKTSSKV